MMDIIQKNAKCARQLLEAAAEIKRLRDENRDLRSMVTQYELLVIPDRGGKARLTDIGRIKPLPIDDGE